MAILIHDDEGEEEAIEVEDNSSLIAPCRSLGVPFNCTEGVCKTCLIEVQEGMENLSEYTEEERQLLGDMQNERLACQCKVKQGKVKFRY